MREWTVFDFTCAKEAQRELRWVRRQQRRAEQTFLGFGFPSLTFLAFALRGGASGPWLWVCALVCLGHAAPALWAMRQWGRRCRELEEVVAQLEAQWSCLRVPRSDAS